MKLKRWAKINVGESLGSIEKIRYDLFIYFSEQRKWDVDIFVAC